jgi:hypothetical protein
MVVINSSHFSFVQMITVLAANASILYSEGVI